MNSKKPRIALLIDCDNVSSSSVEAVISKLSLVGNVTIRHAHGDFKSHCMKSWIEKLQPNAIRPIQQFAFTKGKNATDMSITIDAMDIMFSGKVDAFALMSSDSDFTPLTMRIHENGLPVHGFGETKTPSSFIRACSTFTYLDRLPSTKYDDPSRAEKARTIPAEKIALYDFLTEAVVKTASDDGWSMLSLVGSYIRNATSGSNLDVGQGKLGKILKRTDLFDIQMRSNNTIMFLRPRGSTGNVVSINKPNSKLAA